MAPEASAVTNDLLEAALHDVSRRFRIPGETEGHRRESRLEAREQSAQPLAVGVGENVLRLAAAGPTRTALEAKVDPAPGGGPKRNPVPQIDIPIHTWKWVTIEAPQ